MTGGPVAGRDHWPPQFLPSTNRMYGMTASHFKESIHCQINPAARYLSDLTKIYGGRQDLVLLAYNGTSVPPRPPMSCACTECVDLTSINDSLSRMDDQTIKYQIVDPAPALYQTIVGSEQSHACRD